jgi:hypothetical protein
MRFPSAGTVAQNIELARIGQGHGGRFTTGRPLATAFIVPPAARSSGLRVILRWTAPTNPGMIAFRERLADEPVRMDPT